MVRPRKIKTVSFKPGVTYFKPRAVPLNKLEEVDLGIDELETLRLSNIDKISQSDAAKKMKVHQSTFQRTLARAREKVTDALVNGKAIKIHGGEYKIPRRYSKGPIGHKKGFRRGLGTDRTCICSKCRHKISHTRGLPCNQTKCPECGTIMTRK